MLRCRGDMRYERMNMLDYRKIGTFIADRRREMGLTQAEVAGKEALGAKLAGEIKKEIYVPGRIINIVAK